MIINFKFQQNCLLYSEFLTSDKSSVTFDVYVDFKHFG